VAALGDVADQRRLALGHPAQDEERRAHAMRLQEIEDDARPVADSARTVVPGGSREYRAQVLDLEPFLDVERQHAVARAPLRDHRWRWVFGDRLEHQLALTTCLGTCLS